MASVEGLSEKQCAALAALQIGDLIFVQKVNRPMNSDNDGDRDYSDGGDEANDQNMEDQEETGEDEDECGDDRSMDDDETDQDRDVDMDEDQEDHGTAEDSDDTDATETAVPPKMYVVSALALDSDRKIFDVQVSCLTYSSTLGENHNHTYQIYGNDCLHNHPATCGQAGNICVTSSPITEILQDETFEVTTKPSGDLVKYADPDFRGTNTYARCIANCHNGYMTSHQVLHNMIKDYDPPTLSVQGHDLNKIMPPVCPICFGIDTLKEQQTLQHSLLHGVPPDLSHVIDFIGSLDSRRRQLGHRFRQFDEREWNMVFDDMLSDEDEDDDEDEGRWEDWAEAMDPNNVIQTHPASDATIASLKRKTAGEAALGDEPHCLICKQDIKMDHVLIELPCGHVGHHEDCISQWLKYHTVCPACRALIPAASQDGNPPVVNGAEGRDDVTESNDHADLGATNAVLSNI